MDLTDTITIHEAAVLLKYKKTRSVKAWCKNHGVQIFSEEGSNRKYIIRMQFEYARLKKFIDYLKVKYKSKWVDAFRTFASRNIVSIIELEERGEEISSFRIDNYKPSGYNERKFLEELTKIV